jgi:hypothetical protein
MTARTRRPSGLTASSIGCPGPARSCGHSDHVGTCSACQRVQLRRWAEQLRQAQEARVAHELRVAQDAGVANGTLLAKGARVVDEIFLVADGRVTSSALRAGV